MEKEPVFRKVVGGTTEDKRTFLSWTERQAGRTAEDLLKGKAVEPTPEEASLIVRAVDYANGIAQLYGSPRLFDKARVFVVDEDVDFLRERSGGYGVAKSSSLVDMVVVRRTQSLVAFAQSIAHECFHNNAYHAAQIRSDDTDKNYRSGLALYDRENDDAYFVKAQEAVIAELSYRLVTEVLAKSPEYKQELSDTESVKVWLKTFMQKYATVSVEQLASDLKSVDEVVALRGAHEMLKTLQSDTVSDDQKFEQVLESIADQLKEDRTVVRERRNEREALGAVIERVVVAANSPRVTKEVVFDEFAKAHFSGNYLPLARLVEEALGKGSFREISIELGDIKSKTTE
ncbi:hypothetical protein K2Q16_01925 [Patescibacteria group bacterium]|nr:hypothetical protein [Patescibacteria group bacterium]